MLGGGRLGALSEPRFRLLWLARSTSAIGDRMVPVALTFAVLEIHGSASDLGIVLAAGLIPNVVFVLAGGVAGDRWPRARVMLVSDAVRALTQGTIAALLITGNIEVWHLIASSAAWGTAAAFFAPASTSVVPETVSAARLQQANALMGLTRNVLGLAGPLIAGLLVASAGSGLVFAVDAASFLVSAGFLFLLPLPEREPRQPEPFLKELAEGWRELTSRTWLWVSIAAFGLWSLAIAVYFVLGPLVVWRELGGARDWGVIVSGSAVGSIVGGTIALRWKPFRPLVVVFGVTFVSALQLLALIPPAPTIVLAIVSAAAMIGVTISIAVWTTTLQENVPDRALSRVSAYDWLGSLAIMPLGYALAGPVADAAGLDATLAGAGLLMVVAAGGALLVPSVRAVRSGPRPAASETTAEPVTASVPS